MEKNVIGLTLEEASKIWSNIRVMREDDENCYGTSDLDFTRMNVSITNGIIDTVFDFG